MEYPWETYLATHLYKQNQNQCVCDKEAVHQLWDCHYLAHFLLQFWGQKPKHATNCSVRCIYKLGQGE